MDLLQELEVWYIIPAIRKEIAMAMIDNGIRQVEVAKRLGVTKSAVNQYFKDKRGNDVQLTPKVKDSIKSYVNSINDPKDSVRAIQSLLNLAREEKIACSVHKNIDKSFDNCNLCFEPHLIQ